jgi:hypothetical protein
MGRGSPLLAAIDGVCKFLIFTSYSDENESIKSRHIDSQPDGHRGPRRSSKSQQGVISVSRIIQT